MILNDINVSYWFYTLCTICCMQLTGYAPKDVDGLSLYTCECVRRSDCVLAALAMSRGKTVGSSLPPLQVSCLLAQNAGHMKQAHMTKSCIFMTQILEFWFCLKMLQTLANTSLKRSVFFVHVGKLGSTVPRQHPMEVKWQWSFSRRFVGTTVHWKQKGDHIDILDMHNIA